MSVQGWAADRNAQSGAGIDQVTLYLDGAPGTGTLLGQATLGDSRPDVATSFNDQNLANAGWHFVWDTTNLSVSPHTLYAVAHSSATGLSVTLQRTIGGSLPYPADPAGTIDNPAAGGQVSGVIQIYGWAIDRNGTTGTGVDTVDVYLDGAPGTGTLVGHAMYGDSRPDVGTYFNDPRFNTSGWHLAWDTTTLAYHLIEDAPGIQPASLGVQLYWSGTLVWDSCRRRSGTRPPPSRFTNLIALLDPARAAALSPRARWRCSQPQCDFEHRAS